ncbi:anaerobic sulfatase maturase [Diplocloster agilis]|uniref:anaerobic sulfatase maturase n=1 Tax=Diplocloster agilis TaxID=2850323 RepID=UPI0008229407|nr:anaerobic sulfatase maturase [Suonthocola fibrivorans]MCU6735673.1 anaerobic sulfatase maturase [Suonthocola fibrivorans]SCJ79343.1 Anaerobic sulfatase-maturating enzyme [uncultured Clostridium sp.]
MPPLYLLIKPASSNCNMHCDYCFYCDEAKKREQYSYGYMEADTAENMVKKALEEAEDQCTFAFQGGEPTLAGLPFFQHFVSAVEQYNKKGLPVSYAIQTNGFDLAEEWFPFLKKHKFLVGVSLDGPKSCQDMHRHGPSGASTFQRVWSTIRKLKKYGIEFNVLTVLNGSNAPKIREIYRFLTEKEIWYQQYIPCLDPLGENKGKEGYSLSADQLGEALKELFDLWYEDLIHGKYVYIRQFENWVGILKGFVPESCNMCGRCSVQTVVEANGDVYPCDFYVVDRYRIGNVNTDSFADMRNSDTAREYLEPSLETDEACKDCKWYPLCRGGCRRERDYGEEKLRLNCFCGAYQAFFPYVIERLEQLASAQ